MLGDGTQHVDGRAQAKQDAIQSACGRETIDRIDRAQLVDAEARDEMQLEEPLVRFLEPMQRRTQGLLTMVIRLRLDPCVSGALPGVPEQPAGFDPVISGSRDDGIVLRIVWIDHSKLTLLVTRRGKRATHVPDVSRALGIGEVRMNLAS